MTPPAARGRRRWAPIAVAVAAVLVAGGVGGFYARRGPSTKSHIWPAGAAGPAAPVALIADRGSIAVEPIATGASPITVAPAPNPAVAQPRAGAGAPPPVRRPRSVRSSRAAPGPDTFSIAFARREADIRQCFTRLGKAAMVAEDISVRFLVGRDGHVSSSTVLPATVAASPLGACVAHVAAETVFPPQAEPVAFRIPVTVQLQSRTRSDH